MKVFIYIIALAFNVNYVTNYLNKVIYCFGGIHTFFPQTTFLYTIAASHVIHMSIVDSAHAR